MNSRFVRFAAALSLVALIAAPVFAAARGSANFTQFVTLGDSLTEGVSNLAGVVTHQQYSWPAVVARQVGLKTNCTTDGPGCFQQALIGEPGLLPELYLASLSPLSIVLKPGQGAPINSGLPRPYNNLAVDGAEVADALGVGVGEGNESFSAPIVLRGLGTMVDQAVSLHPTFVGVWLGADDFFGPLQVGNPAGLTSVASFTSDYGTVLDKLIAGAPNAGFVVANLPADIRKIPLVNVLPTVLLDPATSKPVLDPTGKPIPLIADLGGGNFGPLPPGSAVLLTALSKLQTGYGIPAALKPLLPPLPDIGKPLSDADVLTPDEINTFNQRITDYNAAITAAAAARNIPVIDINAAFERYAKGVTIGPISLSLAYVTGGIISLDGGHPTDIGYTLIADEFIKTINNAYGTHIPLAPMAPFLANNATNSGLPFFQSSQGSPWEISSETARTFATMAPTPPQTAPTRYRATHH
jgi:lysophospholipase L1-like esterase